MFPLKKYPYIVTIYEKGGDMNNVNKAYLTLHAASKEEALKIVYDNCEKIRTGEFISECFTQKEFDKIVSDYQMECFRKIGEMKQNLYLSQNCDEFYKE